MPADNGSGRLIDRRRILQSIGAAGALGLAGCVGEDPADDDDDVADDDDDMDDDPADPTELGERFPDPWVAEYWADLGGRSRIMEEIGPVFADHVQELFGVEMEYVPRDLTGSLQDQAFDTREAHITHGWWSSTPDRLDATPLTADFYGLDAAGANGLLNIPQYASCEFHHFATAQEFAPDDQIREAMVTRSMEIMSHDAVANPPMPLMFFSTSNPNTIDLDGVGNAGVHEGAAVWYIKTTPVDGDGWIVNGQPGLAETTNFPTSTMGSAINLFSNVIYSPLTGYDEFYELQGILAQDFWFEADGTIIGAELRDATFHDGTEITSEDVRWTFDHLWGNVGEFPQATRPPEGEWEITIIDDKSVEFEFVRAFPPLVSREWPRWGIFHSEHWIDQGAEDDPGGMETDPVIGSGPYQVDEIVPREIIDMSPHPDHPIFDPEGLLTIRIFPDEISVVEAFIAEEIDAGMRLSPGALERIEEQFPEADTRTDEGFTQFLNQPSTSHGPGMFEAVRKAYEMGLNRELLVEVGLDVDPDTVDIPLFGTPMGPLHPFYPPEDNLYQLSTDPSGDMDQARQILRDAGFDWDADGRLHYPPGADLAPLWPEDSVPQPEDFDCITEITDDGFAVFEPQYDAVDALEQPLEDFITTYGR